VGEPLADGVLEALLLKIETSCVCGLSLVGLSLVFWKTQVLAFIVRKTWMAYYQVAVGLPAMPLATGSHSGGAQRPAV
jgi:hypothetical protein